MVVTVSGSLRFPLGTATSKIAVAGILIGERFRSAGRLPHLARRLTRGASRFRGGFMSHPDIFIQLSYSALVERIESGYNRNWWETFLTSRNCWPAEIPCLWYRKA